MFFSPVGKRRRQQHTIGSKKLSMLAVIALVIITVTSPSSIAAFTSSSLQKQSFHRENAANNKPSVATNTCLSMAPPGSSSLKPMAGPLMDSGKALARSGELLIDFTKALDLYGGALSSAGAQIRNAGDALAQAGASSRFKTGLELVIDELREAAACLSEATDKLQLATEEAEADQDDLLKEQVALLVSPTRLCATKLEEAGAGILMQKTTKEVGASMIEASVGMGGMAATIGELSKAKSQNEDGLLSSQRMTFASERLQQAGIELSGDSKKPKSEGRAFLKGGGF